MDQHTPRPSRFFTVRLQDHQSDLLIRHLGLFRDAVRLARQRLPFEINAAVVLPNRAHMIWTLPPDDDDATARWLIIKNGFAAHVPTPRYRTRAAIARGRARLWQRCNWETPITSRSELEECLDVIRHAPLRDGLVTHAGEWPHGSFADAGMIDRSASATLRRA